MCARDLGSQSDHDGTGFGRLLLAKRAPRVHPIVTLGEWFERPVTPTALDTTTREYAPSGHGWLSNELRSELSRSLGLQLVFAARGTAAPFWHAHVDRHPGWWTTTPLPLSACQTLQSHDGLFDLRTLLTQFRKHLDHVHLLEACRK